MNQKSIKLILTACGCPGAATLIKNLKKINGYNMEIVGVDMDEEAIGRFLVDKFYTVPAASDKSGFIDRLKEIIKLEEPDLVFPESSAEVPVLAEFKSEIENLGPSVLVSSPESIRVANNKYLMYEVLKEETSLELPEYLWPKSLDEFVESVHDLGYPAKPVCFKPHVAKGSRGFRILDANIDRRDLLMNYKPNSRYMSLDEFIKIFQDEVDFPDFIVMEYLPGEEVTTDCLCLDGEELLTTVKTVEQARWGVIVRGELINRPDLIQQTKEIIGAIPLSYCINIQFIGDKLIEINPRVSSFIFQDNWNLPEFAIKLALGEISKSEISNYRNQIDHGRRMVRYMDQIFFSA
jgi:carbamoyl-phosphate synthase large subunit